MLKNKTIQRYSIHNNNRTRRTHKSILNTKTMNKNKDTEGLITGIIIIIAILALIVAIDWILIIGTLVTKIFIPVLIIAIVGDIAALGWCVSIYYEFIDND